MTGNVFAGYLLDAFFNLAGVMTGQSILLVGMMTEGIHTPFLSDRDLALENVRYVLRRGRRPGRGLPAGAGRLHRPAGPGRCWARRSTCCARIGDEGLLDRDRRRHVRGDQAARRRRPRPGRRDRAGRRGYFNPATEILDEAGSDARAGRPDRSEPGHGSSGRTATPPATAWCSCRSPCRCRTAPGAGPGRGRGRCSWPPRWAWTRRWWCTPRHGPGLHVLHRLRPGRTTWSTCREVIVAEREFPLLRRRRSTCGSSSALGRKLVVVGACIGTDAHTVGIDAILNIKGFAGEKGLEYYRGDARREPRRPGGRARPGGQGPRQSRPTRCWSARWSPSATRTCTTPGRCPRRSARRPADRGRCWSSAGPRFDPAWPSRARRGQDLRPGHHTRRGGQLPRRTRWLPSRCRREKRR